MTKEKARKYQFAAKAGTMDESASIIIIVVVISFGPRTANGHSDPGSALFTRLSASQFSQTELVATNILLTARYSSLFIYFSTLKTRAFNSLSLSYT